MKRYMKITLILFLIVICAIACEKRKQTKANTQIITVSSHSLENTLYYSGIIEPLKTVVITSPVDGVISDMLFHYGDEVNSGQLLFGLSSEKFQTDYKTALMQYIKAKTDFMNSQVQLKEGEFLHKNQLISDDDFKAKETSFYNAQLTMVQAKDVLSNLLKEIDMHGVNLFDLKIEDIDKINKVLHVQNGSQQLRISAPAQGVILLPKKGDSAEGELKKITKGDQVKQGDVLGLMGNTSGLIIHISVSEFNINQLKVGQKVIVTGAAFPDYTLDGEISGLDRQGQANQNGLPTFPVEIVVPKLTPEQQSIIHMGMSAKVAIEIGGAAEITVPIKAVFQKDGQSYVNVRDDKTKKIRPVLVKTGQTTLDSVVIQSNLIPGEKVVITG